ncbi:mucin-5AC isoform X1 [Bactrocera oleae]|uniref:mucin-5AC isoform X1 n=2 Tax=Bactrocera oleae TaxID=104688 RepID=UPI00387E4A53
MCTEVNSAMGLQATAATKRKHEITFDAKDANTYTNSPPPLKTGKWSINNNNYIEAIEEQQLNGSNIKDTNASLRAAESTKSTTTTTVNSNNNRNSNSSSINSSTNGLHNSISNGKEVTKIAEHTSGITAATKIATLPSMVATLLPMSSEMAATTPLPPTSTTPVPEDSIAKLEEVAAVPCCEPWTNPATEPVDCISKLQAVAVPSDPWGSIATRSTLATTLLSADELDDDDDDFEDDYEEEESIIPTYCPLRYHTFPPPPAANTSTHQQQRLGSYAPAPHGYGSRPNYYSEPYPQQNCSRTGSPQHMRMTGSNGFTQWQSTNGPSGGGQQFYVPPEAAYPPPQQQTPQPPQQQQTIRCAENGKSYLELGCSSPPPNLNNSPVVPPPPFANLHVATANLDARHPLKRCCDGRGTWCNTNKNCYKDLRLKIRNLSMFKLSRFRQVSEQSLYRSVLICNTLKRIDREIETEAKEMHQAAAQAAAAQHQYHQHLHPPHHLQHHLSPQQPPQQLLVPQQPHTMLHQQHQDYAPPVMNCARLSNMDYQVQHQPPTLLQQQPPQHFAQHLPHYQNQQPERLDTPPPYLTAPTQHLQKPTSGGFALNNSISSINVNNCDSTNGAAAIHPYDHYPFRESQSGRATPFPCQPVMSPAPPSTTPTPATTQTQQHTVATTMSASNTTTAAPMQNACSTAALPSASISIGTTSQVTTATKSIATTDNSDSGYADDDSTRSINWSSVLSLSSQSALDPLNNNDLFAILPPALSITSPATATPVPVTAALTANTSASDSTTQASAVAISGTFTTVQSTSASSTSASASTTSSSSSSAAYNTCTSSSTATFTTLSTISSATHSLTSSYVSSMSANAAAASASSTWEYGFLDMEFGLGSEFTELVPSCKLNSDELFKSSLTPVVAASRYSSVHDNELEQPAHIMVGS